MKLFLLVMFFSLFFHASWAATADTYLFADHAEEKRFVQITEQFRCLVCQNESLADSSAPLAKDLRREIAVFILQGESNTKITQYFVRRYGEFILFRPPFSVATYLLWFAPIIFTITGSLLLLFCFFIKKPSLTKIDRTIMVAKNQLQGE